MYVVTVEFEIHSQHMESFRQAVLTQASSSLTREAACRQFDVSFDPNQLICFLYEKYDDRAAFDEHLASDHFRSFVEMVTPWIAEKNVKTWQLES